MTLVALVCSFTYWCRSLRAVRTHSGQHSVALITLSAFHNTALEGHHGLYGDSKLPQLLHTLEMLPGLPGLDSSPGQKVFRDGNTEVFETALSDAVPLMMRILGLLPLPKVHNQLHCFADV